MFKDNTSGVVHLCFALSSSSGRLESKTGGRVGREGLHYLLRSAIDDRDRIATVMGDIDKPETESTATNLGFAPTFTILVTKPVTTSMTETVLLLSQPVT